MTNCFVFITFLTEDHVKKFKQELNKDGWNIEQLCWTNGYLSNGKEPPACIATFKLTHANIFEAT